MKLTFEIIIDFLKTYPNKDSECEHDFPVDFEIIGDMGDNFYGYLSYLSYKTNIRNEIFSGSYPNNSAKVWKCVKCNRLTFSNTNDSGWGQLMQLKIGSNKEYLIESPDYSAKCIRKIFEKHIDKHARVTTDKWKGYNPIAKDYDVTQILNYNDSNFKALQIMIHQVNSWTRTTYSWISDNNINRYFDGFCYRINRSHSKDIIFNNLIKRMMKSNILIKK